VTWTPILAALSVSTATLAATGAGCRRSLGPPGKLRARRGRTL